MSGTNGSEVRPALSGRETLVIGGGLVGGTATATLLMAIDGDMLAMSLLPGVGLFAALVAVAVARKRAL